jgi:glycosyltransferase involved in cell wall biosynthesis
MQAFYSLPAVIWQKIPLINSQITAAPPGQNKLSKTYLIDRINFHFSKAILSNSKAGIDSYNPPAKKIRVIYNGLNLKRFVNLPNIDQVKKKYGICTPYVVIKVASFTANKDYDSFFRIAKKVTTLRDDITFIGIGGYDGDDSEYRRLLRLAGENNRILFPGKIKDVEALVNACTVGVLFSNKAVHGEGISNAIMEYMSLAKPVLANDAGGTKEIVHHNENGYLITDETDDEIIDLIIGLINNEEKRKLFGNRSQEIINETFSLEKMGAAFEEVYRKSLTQ